MGHSTSPPRSDSIFADWGISAPDVELAKADLVTRIYRLVEQRRLVPEEAAALLNVTTSELAVLFQGRLATCSLDQLLRMLTWLGDDIEILIRPRIRRTKRGMLQVLQAAGVEKTDNLAPGRHQTGKEPAAARAPSPSSSDAAAAVNRAQATQTPGDDRQPLDKWNVEKMTSLDITTSTAG